MEELWTNNVVELVGTLCGRPEFSHRSRKESFYLFPLEIERLSGTTDRVNVVASENIIKNTEITDGDKIFVKGEVRSFNNKTGTGSRLVITVLVREMGFTDESDKNIVLLTGTLCKNPTFRKTPMGREICDMMLAVNRKYERSDYLPCIAWGQTASEASEWTVGTVVKLEGRLQSRNYIKVENGTGVEKTAYEVSIISAEKVNPQ